MPRVKNPLPHYTDGQILRAAARLCNQEVLSGQARVPFRRALAARLYAIARRVPLWTDRKEIGR